MNSHTKEILIIIGAVVAGVLLILGAVAALPWVFSAVGVSYHNAERWDCTNKGATVDFSLEWQGAGSRCVFPH